MKFISRLIISSTIYMCLFAATFSCEEIVRLELPDGEERIVISGWVTNEDAAYQVAITKTISFDDQRPNPGVTGAEVYVTDRIDIRYDFTEGEMLGVYESDPSVFRGIPGNAYVLHVILEDGTEYISAREVLNSVSTLEPITFSSFQDPISNIPNYFVKGVIDDVPSVRNFYRWKMFVNGTLRNTPDDIIIFNDKFTDGNRFENRASNITLSAQDEVFLEHWSMSEGAHDYYELLVSQTKLSFGGTNAPPSIVHGNLVNANDEDELVLGYFGASEITSQQINIDP